MGRTDLATSLNKSLTIGIIGMGNMGKALYFGLSPMYDLMVSKDRKNNKAIVKGSNIIFLCVKPKDAIKVLKEIAPELGEKTLVSVVAGLEVETIRKYLPKARIVRAATNLAVEYRRSKTFVYSNDVITGTGLVDLFMLLGGFHRTAFESEIDTYTAINGSMPALLMYLIQAMADKGEALGIKYHLLKASIESTLFLLLNQHSGKPTDIITKIATPDGITEKGIKVLNDNNIKKIMDEAIEVMICEGKSKG